MTIYSADAKDISGLVCRLTLEASRILPIELKGIIEKAAAKEESEIARQAMSDILRNAELAEERSLPICQDCGLAVVFAEIGQCVNITGGDFEAAINAGVRAAYGAGYLRKSVVSDPLFERENTMDNTPAVIHCRIVPGKDIKITVMPKGMGSENMSRLYMLKPSDGAEGVITSVVEAVKLAGPNPCPPLVLGIGLGGNFETVALAAKHALTVKLGQRHKQKRYAELEREIIDRANALGIGPGGYGGKTTVLDAHIEVLPTHIAGMPLAVNICCHALRHAEGVLEGSALNV